MVQLHDKEQWNRRCLSTERCQTGERVTLNFEFDENEDVNEDHESNQSEDASEPDYNIMKTTISIKAAMKGWISL